MTDSGSENARGKGAHGFEGGRDGSVGRRGGRVGECQLVLAKSMKSGTRKCCEEEMHQV